MEELAETAKILADVQEGDMESSNAEEEFLNDDPELASQSAETFTNASEPRDYPCQYCDEVFRSRQQRHYHIKIAKKCRGLQGIDPQLLKKFNKDEKRVRDPMQSAKQSDQLMTKLKERMKSSLKGQRRHSCPKCGKLFGKPSHVKRHLFTCRGPTFQRTSPIKNTSAAYYKQMQHVMNSIKFGASKGGDHSSLSAPSQQRKLHHLQKRNVGTEARSTSTQSNFLAFGIESMEDLVALIPQFLTLEGWTYNLLQDGIAMIQCILDTDTLESNWSKTVLIRSCLENDDPTTFEVVIKSKVPGYEYLMLEEQTAKLNSVADVFEVMGIPLEEEEDDEETSTELMPSTQRAVVSGIGAGRSSREDAMDRFLSFGGEQSAAGGSAALTSALPRGGLGSGGGGVVNEEGDDEMTDDEIHSIGEDQEPAPDVAAALVARPKGKERVCRVCGISGFAHRQALYRHIKKTHPHNQCWNCPICREEFSCQNTFMDHYDHHRVVAAGETESRAVAFEKVNVEKFMESVDEDEDGVVSRDKMSVHSTGSGEDTVVDDGGGDGSAASGAGAAANAIKRRKACGDCPPCRITENCEECTACRTRATSKQKCEKRKCLNMIFTKFEDHQQYEVKQLLFSEWALQKTLSQPESSHPLNEVVKDGKPKKVMKTFWKCKICGLTFPSKDKGVVLSHIATCHRDLAFTDA